MDQHRGSSSTGVLAVVKGTLPTESMQPCMLKSVHACRGNPQQTWLNVHTQAPHLKANVDDGQMPVGQQKWQHLLCVDQVLSQCLPISMRMVAFLSHAVNVREQDGRVHSCDLKDIGCSSKSCTQTS